MHISHDFIATKTCPSYEFLEVSDRFGFETEKVRGGRGLGWTAWRVRVSRVRVRAQNLNPRRTLVPN